MITIEKISEAFVRVISDISIEQDIKDHFTYKAPGYRYSPKFKAGLWSGDISLYNVQTKRLPIGLLPRLLKFAEDTSIPFKLIDSENYSFDDSIDSVSREEVVEYVDSLNIQIPNNGKPREYQIDAIYQAVTQKKITLLSPVSSGKSLIIFTTIRWILDKNPHAKIILMVPSVQLVNQMYSDFEEYAYEFDVAKHCQKIFSGQPKELTKQILITTWQSLKNIAASPVNGQKILSEYTAVFADECHTSQGKEIQAILEKCRNAAYRIGTTGTLNNEKVHQLLIEGFLGPVYKVITTKELIDSNQVSNLDIRCFSLNYPEQFCKDFSVVNDKGKKVKISYPDEISFLIKNKKRNDFICKIAIASTGTTLILVNHVNDHAKPLYDRLKEMSDKPVYYVSGEVSADRREEIRKVANMEDCIIVGTYGTLQQGVNIPNIRNVIFGCPSKSPIRVLQSIGRGLRLHKDKDKMILIDIIDDIRYKNKENFSYIHGLERISIYRKEKFNINVKEIDFNL